VFVTGAATGIGAALCTEVARRGGFVSGTFRGAEETQRDRERELEAFGGNAMFADVDVRDLAGLREFAGTAVEAMGGLDLWVNNAVMMLSRPFLETSEADWMEVLDTNLLGYVRGCRVAADLLEAGGCIVNVSSITSLQPPANLAAYSTAKGGVDSLTRSLAVELAPLGIRVNAVAPGAIDTALNIETWSDEARSIYETRAPLGRLGHPEDIAGAILLLAGPEAGFITGEVLVADGGFMINGTVGHRVTS
jgi:NAD(P)-dependent dehydrogenase (short-subunit alcohol dehydrogenase family)